MPARWCVKELDAMPRDNADGTHFPRRKTAAPSVHLLRIARGDDAIVHHDHHSLASRIVRCSDSHRRKQIDRTIRADAGRWPLGPHKHNWLLGPHCQMKKECRFLEPVCTVRYNDPGNLRTLLERRIDIS